MTGRKNCPNHVLALPLLVVLVVVLAVECQSEKNLQKNRSDWKPDFSQGGGPPPAPAPPPPPPPLSSSSSSSLSSSLATAAASARILSRHKRIKKSASTVKLEDRNIPPARKYASSGEKGKPEMDDYDKGDYRYYGNYKSDGDSQRRFRQKSRGKKPKMTLTMADPYVTKGLVEKDSLKKFKRSLAYYGRDYGGHYDYNNNNNNNNNRRRKTPSDRRKMRGSSEFYSLAEAKSELDRRRRLIRKLEKKIKYDKNRLPKKKKKKPKKTMTATMKTLPSVYSTGQYQFQSRPVLRPTVESIGEAFSTRALLQQMKDPLVRGLYGFDRKQFLSDGTAVKTKMRKGISPVKSI